MNKNQNIGCVKELELPIPSAMTQLNDKIILLENLLDDLEKRIAPILCESYPQEIKESESVHSLFEQSIVEKRNKVENMIEFVSSILNRIQL